MKSGSEPESEIGVRARIIRGLCLAVALLAVVILVASGPGVRLGLWPYQAGFLLMRIAVFLGAAAAILSLIVLWRAPAPAVLVALILGLAAAAVPLEQLRRARSHPPINDVSTGGEIQPLLLQLPFEQALARAHEAARDMGWEVTAVDPRAGRIEAVATTFWFGFKDDVTVSVTRQAAGSRIDVRSRSRVGRGDAGANAARIRRYLEKLRA